MDVTNSICWLWGTCSYAGTSLGMVALVIVPITQSEKWDVVEWKLWEWVGITKRIWDKNVSGLEVDEERKRLVEKGNSLIKINIPCNVKTTRWMKALIPFVVWTIS